MTRSFLLAGCAGLLALPGLCSHAGAAHAASFYGSIVDETQIYPEPFTAGPSESAIVGSGVEFPPGALIGENDFQTDIQADRIVFTMTSDIPLIFQAADFNGFQLSFLGAPVITHVDIDPATSASFATVGHSWTTTSVIFDLSGVVTQPHDALILDVAFATDPGGNPNNPTGGVPEPGTWAMMAAGFAGLAFTALRRRKTARAVA